MEKLTKSFGADITITGDREVTAIISTSAVDRDGDVLVPQGCVSKNFEANPVVLFAHDYFNELPVAQCTDIKRTDRAIITKTAFAERPAAHPENQEWFPDTLLSLYKQGVLRAFSVGFQPIDRRPANEADVKKYGAKCRTVISKWELLEYSVVPIPSNQEAVALAVSKGLSLSTASLLGYRKIVRVDLPAGIDAELIDTEIKNAIQKARGAIYA